MTYMLSFLTLKLPKDQFANIVEHDQVLVRLFLVLFRVINDGQKCKCNTAVAITRSGSENKYPATNSITCNQPEN